ncbi:MAG: plastocyanin/azurin family copper-binding protein [Candidatus Paceibacterota bacterium]|jgi:plastocyanin
MNRNSTGLVVVLIIIAGGWYFLSKAPAGEPVPDTTNQMPVIGETATDTVVTSGTTITYTDQGFSPASVTIAQGETVTWVNQSSKDMWVASAMHPTHMAYDGTALKEHCATSAPASFDACRVFSSGASYSFTFDKAGTWKYHNHLDASKFGTVIVTAPI